MLDGFLWYSFYHQLQHQLVRYRCTHLKVSKEGVYEKVEDNKGSQSGIDEAHQQESLPQPSLHALARENEACRNLRLYQLSPLHTAHKGSPNFPIRTKQKLHQAEPKIPLERFGELTTFENRQHSRQCVG